MPMNLSLHYGPAVARLRERCLVESTWSPWSDVALARTAVAAAESPGAERETEVSPSLFWGTATTGATDFSSWFPFEADQGAASEKGRDSRLFQVVSVFRLGHLW